MAMRATRQGEMETSERELVITRNFDARRVLVFRMWTEREHLEKLEARKGER